MKFIRITLVMIFLFFTTAVFTDSLQAQFFMFENPLVDKPAPNFSAETLFSGETDLATFRDGHKSIVFFWATWCPHCRTQLKELNKMKTQLEKSKIKIILVDLAEPAAQVASYMKKNKIDFEVFLDKDQSISEEYGVIGVPTFYFINNEGIIKAVEHEIPSNYEEILSS